MRRRVLLCVCVVVIAWITRPMVGAQSSEPVRYHFMIDSQPLGTALQEFARQSGVQIIFFSQATEGIKAPALHGTYTIADALERLLIGSHLLFRVINPKTIEIYVSTAIDLGMFAIRPLGTLWAAIDTERTTIVRLASIAEEGCAS